MQSNESKTTPLISIVTPIYNAEPFLQKTLESVFAQTHTNWEQWLVIDANCTDKSLEIAKNFSKQSDRFRVLTSTEFRGVVNNRNAALNEAKGQYIAFLDADDLWMPEKLERQLQFMVRTGSKISCHEYTPIDENGKVSGPIRKVPPEINFKDLLKDNSMGCLTVMVKRSFLENQRFENIKHEDLALWLRLLKDGETAAGIQENLAYYRVLSNSVSSNKLKAATWRWKIYRSLGFSMNRSMLFLAKYGYFAFKKRIKG